ncbi:MAG: 1-aminocyclopropane-1-carboxylate deaminase [Thalassobius sp.]|nr:1-aminocyclopropane-1-carboxylate deaminase [Thalassovita sp.]
MQLSINKTSLEKISSPLLDEKKLTLYVKRDDLIHPTVSGNKWRKLKYNLQEAQKQKHDTLLTFGGAYSNHIYALAAAGKLFGFKTIGIIRGEKTLPLNPVLEFAQKSGMRLYYISRTAYRDKYNPELIGEFKERFGKFYLVPEGGTNMLAVQGCEEIVEEIDIDFDYICCASGTGGTISGIITGLNGKHKALGFSALKGGEFLKDDVGNLVKGYCGKDFDNWDIITDYHFGGYAKSKPELLEFMKQFEKAHKIPLEFIYTGKMLYGLFDLIKKDYFKEGQTIIAVHTGGVR